MHLVALLQELQFGGGALPIELVETAEHLLLEHQAVAQHLLFGVIHRQVAAELLLLEAQLLLLEQDRLLHARLAVLGGLGVELQQQLPLLHPVPFLHQHLIHHATHRHLHILHHAQGFQLPGSGHDLLGFGEGQPGQSKAGDSHQGPADAAGPKA